MIKKYIGDKQFYAGIIYIALPLIVQNIISNFVNLLDNIMVGQVGTEAMSGVAIVNQLIFVFNLGVFGFTSGAGILESQYYGNKDHEGVANTFKMKLFFCGIFLLTAYGIFHHFGDNLIWLYLHEGNAGLDLNTTFDCAKEYIKVILWGLPFFSLSQCYSTTLRDIKETRVPMVGGLAAVFVNLVFNYLLIYGKFGFPKLGIVGAAIATNISRVVEFLIIVIWTHRNTDKVLFAKAVYKKIGIPGPVVKKLLVLAIPAFINEILWGMAQTGLNQCLSVRGIEVLSAVNITSTIQTLCKSFYLSMGVALAIVVGNALGANELDVAVDTQRKMTFLSFSVSLVFAVILFSLSNYFPMLYNTEPEVRDLASTFIKIAAILMPMESLINAQYHTMKSGGRIFITFMFDGGYSWVITVPLAFVLAHYTNISIVPMFFAVYGINIIKLAVGTILVRKKLWVRNLVS